MILKDTYLILSVLVAGIGKYIVLVSYFKIILIILRKCSCFTLYHSNSSDLPDAPEGLCSFKLLYCITLKATLSFLQPFEGWENQ